MPASLDDYPSHTSCIATIFSFGAEPAEVPGTVASVQSYFRQRVLSDTTCRVWLMIVLIEADDEIEVYPFDVEY